MVPEHLEHLLALRLPLMIGYHLHVSQNKLLSVIIMVSPGLKMVEDQQRNSEMKCWHLEPSLSIFFVLIFVIAAPYIIQVISPAHSDDMQKRLNIYSTCP